LDEGKQELRRRPAASIGRAEPWNPVICYGEQRIADSAHKSSQPDHPTMFDWYNIRLDGILASRLQSSVFNHAGDTLNDLPRPWPRSIGDTQCDIGFYHILSGVTKILTGHHDAITRIGYSPDNSLVVSACWDRTFRVWEAKTGEQRFQMGG